MYVTVLPPCLNYCLSPLVYRESSTMVTLPADVTCDNCTIRLVRQALEWGSGYIFWTCADIRIVDKNPELCSGHGTFEGGECKCNKLYSGDRCQNWGEEITSNIVFHV